MKAARGGKLKYIHPLKRNTTDNRRRRELKCIQFLKGGYKGKPPEMENQNINSFLKGNGKEIAGGGNWNSDIPYSMIQREYHRRRN